MIDYEQILKLPPYSMNKAEKEQFLTENLRVLSMHHAEKCHAYEEILKAHKSQPNKLTSFRELPFVPVRLFKEYDLRSVETDDVVKTMTSSGTTGQQVSKIYLDKQTSLNQSKTLTRIVSNFLGSKRLPMIVLDASTVIKDRRLFSARGAGILGFSMFASTRIFALDEEMKLDMEGLKAFLQKHEGSPIFLFGFTFMIWQHFLAELEQSEEKIDLSKAILVHGGGWKKLISQSVTSDVFKARLNKACGIKVENIHDYYGMVEQTGTIYMECECGHLHASIFSDVIIRSPKDFSEMPHGEKGIMQVVSILPSSYPGHSLLTEDEGVILGEDDCPCGRKGKYFAILGRIKNAELRGCSDTYADKF